MSVSILTNPNPGSWCNLYARSWNATEYLNSQGITTLKRDELIATDGMIIYNSDANEFQGYINGSWQSLATASQIPPNHSSYFLARENLGQAVTSQSTVLYGAIEQNETDGSTGNYDNTTGIYTVPFDGLYQFNAQVSFFCSQGTFLLPRIHIAAVGSGTTGLCQNIDSGTYTADPTKIHTLVASGCAHLQAGNQVFVNVSADGLDASNVLTVYIDCFFSGCLIKAD